MKRFFGSALAFIFIAGTAAAQSTITRDPQDHVIETYEAFIGQRDLYNSRGERLNEPWQIIRQDRANVHAYGISDPGDSSDSFFAAADNRAKLERMLSEGSISGDAAAMIWRGNVRIQVDIIGRGAIGTSVQVRVID